MNMAIKNIFENNKITLLLGIKYPILQGFMSQGTDSRLV